MYYNILLKWNKAPNYYQVRLLSKFKTGIITAKLGRERIARATLPPAGSSRIYPDSAGFNRINPLDAAACALLRYRIVYYTFGIANWILSHSVNR